MPDPHLYNLLGDFATDFVALPDMNAGGRPTDASLPMNASEDAKPLNHTDTMPTRQSKRKIKAENGETTSAEGINKRARKTKVKPAMSNGTSADDTKDSKDVKDITAPVGEWEPTKRLHIAEQILTLGIAALNYDSIAAYVRSRVVSC